MIVVETNIVQNRRSLKRNKTAAINDHPIADRLDRSYFGFDQDYYERMPLLVNAMQENSYTDPSTELFETPHKIRRFPESKHIKLTTENFRAIRRTSPRPFLYEYRNPVPAPFSKNYGKSYASRSWVESYRNAQRLKNLNEIIKYLERTINAKFGDFKTQTSTRIAFSGIYVEPFEEYKTTHENDLLAEGTSKQEFKINHKFDPLYTFKPDHPGEINLLAEGLRFAPTPELHFVNDIVPTVPMFRQVPNRKQICIGHVCNNKDITNVKISTLSSHESSDIKDHSPLKPFGVMLNLYPMHSTDSIDTVTSTVTTPTDLDKIYFTTSRPKFQFRRKSSFPIRRTSMKSGRRFSSKVKYNDNNLSRARDISRTQENESSSIPKMIVHLNVYSVKQEIEKNQNSTELTTQNAPATAFTSSTSKTMIDKYPTLNSSNVEDYHIGSSGIIPVEERTTTPPTLPIITPIVPLFDTAISKVEVLSTQSPDVIKFSPEDAKIPDQYLNLRKSDDKQVEITEIKRSDEATELYKNNFETRTLIARLKNYDPSNNQTQLEPTKNYEDVTQTYVPQTNSHYRNAIHKSLSALLQENSERYRRKLENSTSSIRKSTYVPMYVELKRNHTGSQNVKRTE